MSDRTTVRRLPELRPLPIWAAVLPLALRPGDPIPDPRNLPGVEAPDHVRGWTRA